MPEHDRKIPSPNEVLGKKDRVIPKPGDVLKKKVPTTGSVDSPDLSQGVLGGVLTEELVGSTSGLEPSTLASPESLIDAGEAKRFESLGAKGFTEQRQATTPVDNIENTQQPQITEPPVNITGPVRTQAQAELGTPIFNKEAAKQKLKEQDIAVRDEAIRKKKSILPRWMGVDMDPETGELTVREKGNGLKGFVTTKAPSTPSFDIKLSSDQDATPKGFLKTESLNIEEGKKEAGSELSLSTGAPDIFFKAKDDQRHVESLKMLNENDVQAISEGSLKFEAEYFGNADDLDRFETEAKGLMIGIRNELPEEWSDFKKEKVINGIAVRAQERFEQRKSQVDKDRRMIELQKKAKIYVAPDASLDERLSPDIQLVVSRFEGDVPMYEELSDDENRELHEYLSEKDTERGGYLFENKAVAKLGKENYDKRVDDLANSFYSTHEIKIKGLYKELNDLYDNNGSQQEINDIEEFINRANSNAGVGGDKIYDPLTGERIGIENASPAIVDWNNRVNTAAVELSRTNTEEDLKALKSRYYANLKYLENDKLSANADAIIKARELFSSSARALDLNSSITTIKRNAWERVIESGTEAMGFDYSSEEDVAHGFVSMMNESGLDVSKEETERVEQRFVDKLASTVGGSVPVMLEIMFWTAVTEGAGFTGALERGLARLGSNLAKGEKSAKMINGLSRVISNAANREVQFQLAGESGGAGESLGGELGTALGGNLSFLGNSKIGRILRTGLTLSGRAAGETIEEYSGELFTELMKDQTFSEAFGTVIGDDPFEKLALTYITGAIFASGKIGTDYKNSKIVKEMEEVIRNYDGDSEVGKQAKELEKALNAPKEGDQLKLEFKGEDLIGKEGKVTKDEKPSDIISIESIPKADTEYKIGEDFFSEKEIKEKLKDPEFVEGIKSGDTDLKVVNPSTEIESSLIEAGLIEKQIEDVKKEITPKEEVVKTPIEGEQQITKPTEGEVETKIEEDGKDKETKIGQAQEAEVLVEPVKTIKETTLESLEKDLEGEFVSPEAKEDIEGKIDQLKTEIEEEVNEVPDVEPGKASFGTVFSPARRKNKTLNKKQQELINKLPKIKINYKNIKGIGDLESFLNNPDALDSPDLRSARDIYEEIVSGKEIKNTPAVREAFNNDVDLLDGQNRIKAQLAAGITDIEVAVIESSFFDNQNKSAAPEIELKKVPKTVTGRFIQSGLTEEEANKVAEISQKAPTTDVGRLKVIGDIESEVGLDKAFDITSNEKTNKTFSEETKNYFSIAKANDLKAKALKAPTKQERSKLIEQAANIMAKVAKSAEKKGAENQFFNAIYDKFPEMRTKASVVNNINQKIQAALESESDVRGLTVGEEIGDLKSKIEQEVRKQIESEVEALKSEIEQLRIAKPGKARVVKGRKQVNEALAEIKKIKSRKGPTSAGASFIPGVSADMINAVGKLIAGYVNIGIGSTKAIISKVTKDLKDADVVISAEDIARIAEKDNSFADLSKDEQIEQFASKNIELALEDFFVNGNSSKETLAGHLSERLNIPLSDAKKISTKLEEKVLGKVEEIAKAELEKDLKITDDLTEEEKTRRRKKQRESGKIVNKVSKSVMLGSLSNTDFRNSFAEKYGFPEVTAEQMSLLEDLVNDAKRFEKSGQRELHQKTQRRINTELRKMKPKDADFYANLIMELAYTNVLSGINTQGNANIGAISTSIIHAVGKSLEQLGRGKLGAVSYGLRGIGKSYKAASAAAKEARRFNYSKFTDHNAYMEGATDLEMSVLESEVTQGMGHYLRKVSREKSLTDNTKNIVRSIRSVLLQYSRMNFLLNASDAFLTTSFTEFNNAIEVYNQETKADGIKGTVNNIVNRKDLIKRLDKAMGYDNRAQIDATVDNEIKAEEEKIDKEVDALLLSPKESKREKKRRKDLTISKGYKSRRTQELLTQRRDREIYDNAVKTARDWIMLSDPDGLFGMANESFKKFLKIENKKTTFGKAWATFWGLNIMFTRMTAKTANAVMTSIPGIGLVPTLVGYSKQKDGSWKFGFKGKADPLLMKRRLIANALMTTAAASVFAEMFEWDDDEEEYRLDPNRLIDVTVGGFGGTNAVKNQQSLKNYSGYGLAVSFRSSPEEEFGPYRSLKYLPQALPAFAVLGNYADRTRGLGTDKKLDKFNEQEGVWKLVNGASASIAVSQMLEGSFNSIGRATQKISMSDSEGFLEGLGTAGFDMVMSPVKTVTQPNFYRDLINESGMRGDVKKAYPKGLWGKIKYDYFGLDGAEENKTDIFGNEYPIQNKLSQWADGTINDNYNNPEWKLIHKFPEVTITPFRAKEDINLDGHTVRLKDEELIKEYSDIQKSKLKTLITNDKTYNIFNKLEAENLQLGLNKLRSKSIEAAKEEMIKKYIGTDKIEIIK